MLESEGGKQRLSGKASSCILTFTSPTSNKVENSTGEMNNTKDTEESGVSLYAVPEKVKSKVSLVINSLLCASEENSL